MLEKPPDKRSEYRLSAEETVFIDFEASDLDPSLINQLIISSSVDISASGICITCNQQIPVGNIYPLYIQLERPKQSFQLAAEVKWVRKIDCGDDYKVGFSIFESEETDIQAWREMIAKRSINC